MKRRKNILILAAAALLALGLTACGSTGGVEPDYDLVFVSGVDREIVSVVVTTPGQTSGTQYASGVPMRQGDTFGFQMESYPATVTACADANGSRPVAKLTVEEAPPEGERWYVTANSTGRVTLALSSGAMHGDG